jgi:hypothetical protein
VKWFRDDSNLHRVWDSDMIDDTHLSYTELGESLLKPDNTLFVAWQKSTVRDWANESMALRHTVYDSSVMASLERSCLTTAMPDDAE